MTDGLVIKKTKQNPRGYKNVIIVKPTKMTEDQLQ